MSEVKLPYPKPADDWMLVPTEPTIEMLNAYDEARAATTMTASNGVTTYNPHQSYWAMLAAAPKRPVYNGGAPNPPNAADERVRKMMEIVPDGWDKRPLVLSTELRGFLKSIVDRGTNIDSGGGDGIADLHPIIDGIEYHIAITSKK